MNSVLPEWGRVGGFHFGETAGAVWLAHDSRADVIHLYTCCLFRDPRLALIAEGLKARGDWPIAWAQCNRELERELLYGGARMIPEGLEETDAMAAALSAELADRLNTERFKVDPGAAEWSAEYEKWQRSDEPVARTPLLCATRYALARLDYARPRGLRRGGKNYPDISIL